MNLLTFIKILQKKGIIHKDYQAYIMNINNLIQINLIQIQNQNNFEEKLHIKIFHYFIISIYDIYIK